MLDFSRRNLLDNLIGFAVNDLDDDAIDLLIQGELETSVETGDQLFEIG